MRNITVLVATNVSNSHHVCKRAVVTRYRSTNLIRSANRTNYNLGNTGTTSRPIISRRSSTSYITWNDQSPSIGQARLLQLPQAPSPVEAAPVRRRPVVHGVAVPVHLRGPRDRHQAKPSLPQVMLPLPLARLRAISPWKKVVAVTLKQ